MDCQPGLKIPCGLHRFEPCELLAFDTEGEQVRHLPRKQNVNYEQIIND